jgi:tetratricopeptide (TPR) repeat protein
MKSNSSPIRFAMLLALVTLPAAFALTAFAQARQLTLADILIALRSNKVTLQERNKLLTEAVTSRGTTFSLTPEIEKELSGTGADRSLLESIRQRAAIVKVSTVVASSAEAKPRIEPPKVDPPASPPDFSFFEKRADESVAKGNIDAGIADYTRAIDLNASDAKALRGRANCYVTKGLYAPAVVDLTKVIELDPKDAAAYAARAQIHEKQGGADLALEDYKTAYRLDPTNEIAKTVVERWQAEQAKAAAPVVPPAVAVPEFVDLGMLTEATAVRMMKPAFTPAAIQAGAGGQVVVYVELDAEGNVTKAKSLSGNILLRQGSEDAARHSKFKPAMFDSKPIKAKGQIVYNFVSKNR